MGVWLKTTRNKFQKIVTNANKKAIGQAEGGKSANYTVRIHISTKVDNK